ncbi:MAG: universal stress protein, partial [Acidobacteria bacterium]|nr:universal stress protein [Acidobacteriota bacterium]
LVHAFEVPMVTAVGAPFAPLIFEAAPGSQELAQAARARMTEQIARLQIAGDGDVVQHVEQGPAHRALVEVAQREAADLIVVGAADTRAAHVFGSTAGRVLRKARCPVIVLRGALPVPPRTVLLPVDLSPLSGEVVTRGLALLDQWRRAAAAAGTPGAPGAWQPENAEPAVEALTVVVPIGFEGFVPHFDIAGAERGGVEQLGEFLSAAGCADRQMARVARFGGAREEILNRISATAPDLVVMGTHGLSGFERLMLGSVAEGVARSCRTSVLVIPPLAAARAEAAPASAQQRPAA